MDWEWLCLETVKDLCPDGSMNFKTISPHWHVCPTTDLSKIDGGQPIKTCNWFAQPSHWCWYEPLVKDQHNLCQVASKIDGRDCSKYGSQVSDEERREVYLKQMKNDRIVRKTDSILNS